MKYPLITASLVLMLLCGCGKDELETATLNSNVLDPAYSGPSMIEFHDGHLTFIVNGMGDVVDTVYTLRIRLQVERFPSQTVYDIQLHDPTTNSSGGTNNVQGSNPGIFGIDYHHAIPGQEYCLNAQVFVGGSGSAVWSLCHVAQ